MAEYTALHEAANAVVELLRREMTPEPIGKRELIGLCPPYDPEDYQLTVHLYHVDEDGHRRQPSYGFVPEGTESQRAAPLPLNLHLLITAHSKAPAQTRAADEARIFGRAMQVVRDNPTLDGKLLTGSLAGEGAPLALQLEKAMTLDQLTRAFGGANKPYKLSFGCYVGVVLLESRRLRSVTRVREVRIGTEEKEGNRE